MSDLIFGHITLMAPEVWDDKFVGCGDWGSPILSSRASVSKEEECCNCIKVLLLLGDDLGEWGIPEGWAAINGGAAYFGLPPLLPIFTNGIIGTIFGEIPTY